MYRTATLFICSGPSYCAGTFSVSGANWKVLRSASHDDTDNTSNRVNRRVAAAQLCWTIICLISWLLDYKADTASSTLLYSYDELKYGPPWTPAVQILGVRTPSTPLWMRLCLKLISFTNHSSIVTLIPSGLTSWILTCTELKGHCFVCFSFWLRVLD